MVKGLRKMGKYVKLVRRMRWLLILVVAGLLAGCGVGGGEVLPLAEEPYQHPSGIFTIPIPEGWQVVQGETEDIAWLTPPEGGPDVTVVMIAAVLPGETEDEMNAAAQDLLEAYLVQYLPYDDYEIYNSAEMRVQRNPAMLLDFARPLGESYHVGRMEMIYLPAHLVYLAGFGPRADWDPFLPTFRQMVEGMSFSIQPLMEGME
jgi:hypothetical protein